MKSDYRVRAQKFLKQVWPYLSYVNMEDIDSVQEAVNEFLRDHPSRRVKVFAGSARIALITSDYVIKWDYDEDNVSEIGGCSAEVDVYQRVKQAGFSYLFAEVTPVFYKGYGFVIMPKIAEVEKRKEDIRYYLNYAERQFIKSIHLTDLHSYNWGMKNGYPVIIDYAYISDYDED